MRRAIALASKAVENTTADLALAAREILASGDALKKLFKNNYLCISLAAH
jgi:hypothetical protein